MAGRAAVRPPLAAGAVDRIVVVACLRAGRSIDQHRDPGDTGAGGTSSAPRSYARVEGVTQRRANRREELEGTARLTRGRPQEQGRAVQTGRTAETAATAGRQGTTASAAGPAATATCRRAADQPPAARHATLRLVGRFRRRGRH